MTMFFGDLGNATWVARFLDRALVVGLPRLIFVSPDQEYLDDCCLVASANCIAWVSTSMAGKESSKVQMWHKSGRTEVTHTAGFFVSAVSPPSCDPTTSTTMLPGESQIRKSFFEVSEVVVQTKGIEWLQTVYPHEPCIDFKQP